MKLDSEMDRLTLEHGTMLGPPTEEERAEETAKKKLTNKVGHGMDSWAGMPSGVAIWSGWLSHLLQIDLPSFRSTRGPKSSIFAELWVFLRAVWGADGVSRSALKTLSPTALPALVSKFLAIFSAVQWVPTHSFSAALELPDFQN